MFIAQVDEAFIFVFLQHSYRGSFQVTNRKGKRNDIRCEVVSYNADEIISGVLKYTLCRVEQVLDGSRSKHRLTQLIVNQRINKYQFFRQKERKTTVYEALIKNNSTWQRGLVGRKARRGH